MYGLPFTRLYIHNSWEKAYDNDSMYTWLLAQKKFTYKEIKPLPKFLNQYAGIFVGAGGDTIAMHADSAGLHAKTRDNIFLLKQAGEDDFFLPEDIFVDIKFNRSKQGVYDSFIVFADKKVFTGVSHRSLLLLKSRFFLTGIGLSDEAIR